MDAHIILAVVGWLRAHGYHDLAEELLEVASAEQLPIPFPEDVEELDA